MLLFPLLLLTSLATAGEQGHGAARVSVLWLGHGLSEDGRLPAVPEFRLQSCNAATGVAALPSALPCVASAPTLALETSTEWDSHHALPAATPEQQPRAAVAQGGFVHVNLIDAARFGAGPEISWMTAGTPHEDLLRLRLATPGIGVWYSLSSSRLFLGISANTSVSTLGETWFVHALSSEARVGFSL